MSHERSFQHMSAAELFAIVVLNKYQADLLKGDQELTDMVKTWGIGGLEEAWYTGKHRAIDKIQNGHLEGKISGLELELERAEEELIGRFKLGVVDQYQHDKVSDDWMQTVAKKVFENDPESSLRDYEEIKAIWTTAVNPASFTTFSGVRKRLRRERLRRMRGKGAALYWTSEGVAYLQQTATDFGNSVADSVGAVGDFTRNNFFEIGIGLSLIGGVVGTYKLINQDANYRLVVKEYVNSHEVGNSAYILKREIPALNKKVKSKLTSIDDDDYSHPQKARVIITQMENEVNEALSLGVMENWETVDELDIARLEVISRNAYLSFDGAEKSLRNKWNSSKTYRKQINSVKLGTSLCQDAADVLENYMDPKIVEAENEAHSSLNMMKYVTGGAFGVAAFLGYCLLKVGRRRRHYRF